MTLEYILGDSEIYILFVELIVKIGVLNAIAIIMTIFFLIIFLVGNIFLKIKLNSFRRNREILIAIEVYIIWIIFIFVFKNICKVLI